jgi:hypothetical protein
VLLVAEGVHATAADDVPGLVTALADGIERTWGARPLTGILTAAAPSFEL